MNLSRDGNERNSGGDIKEEEAVSLINNELKFTSIIVIVSIVFESVAVMSCHTSKIEILDIYRRPR
jgi:hypothetical protein